MTKFVTVILADEGRAYEATRALKELHSEGSLTVYAMAVVAAGADGKLTVKQSADEGPLGTGVGALAGGLAGVIAGPAGAAIGMGSGAMIGGMNDILNAGVRTDFVTSVSEKLKPGKAAVIAEVIEDWVTPLDTRMEALGGHVIREWRSDFEDEQIDKEVRARKADLGALQAEFDGAREDRKKSLKARIDEAQAKLTVAAARAQGRMEQLQRESQARVKELQGQAATAKGGAKASIDKHIAETHVDYDRRTGKLKQAWQLTKEAFKA